MGRIDDSVGDEQAVEQTVAFANAPISNAELQLGRAIWEDVMATGRVTLGTTGKWNWLTFDELMSLPQENPEGRGAAIQGLDIKPRSTEAGKKPRKLPEVRPRLFVEEDLVWRTLTGHGEDFRRVPLMEWRLLVVIASTQEEGIIQGDLVRATGQDKRSVPRRTDFLRNKGYIAKRTHLVRGSKTSKLWLVQFAPELPAPSSNAMNKARALLTRDMEPVPWYHQWVNNKSKTGRDEIHYQNFAQTIVGIIKAWGTLRIRDLKKKLGISGFKWQMKVMSKFLRRFNAQGNMVYAAAKFPGNNFVFKDCVKFIRDPTEQDWRDLLATGKKTKVGSGNSKKAKGKAKKAKKVKGKAATSASKRVVRFLKKKYRNTPRPLVSLWEPDKPLANTIADFIITGGDQGYTTPEISHAVVTHQFRRYLKTHLDQTCGPDPQPARLREYRMTSELTKTGKGTRKFRAETFTCSGPHKSESAQNTPEESVIDPALTGPSIESQVAGDPFGFETVNNNEFHQETSDLTALCAMKPPKSSKSKRAYRRRPAEVSTNDLDRGRKTAGQEDDPAAASPKPVVRKKGRPRKVVEQPAKGQAADAAATEGPSATRPTRKRRAAQSVSYADMTDNMERVDADSVGAPGRKQMGTGSASGIEIPAKAADKSSDEFEEEEEDRSKPGVYIGIPGSLNPEVKKKGRPRKSIVLIFRSDRLKDPNFFSGGADHSHSQAELQATESAPTPGRAPVSAPVAHTTSHVAVRQQGRGRGPAQAPQVSHAEEVLQLQSEDVNPEAEKDTIVVQDTSATGESQHTQANTSTVTSVQTAEQSSSPAAAHAPSSKGEWDCPKCGFPFKGSNGLKYHLEKGKNKCNPVYAENPELMVRKKPNRSGQDPQSDDHAEPTEPSSSESSSECSSAESLPPVPEPRRQSGKPKVPRGKKATPLRRIDPNDANDPANQRPRVLLKQRRDLKSRQVGIGGLSVKPRGVEASEAAAKEAAAAKFTEVPAETADSIDAHKEDGVASAEEDDEDLPYIDFIRPKSVKFAGLPDANAFAEAKNSNGAYQPREGGSPHHEAIEAQPAVFDPYPAEALDLAKRTMSIDGGTSLATSLKAGSVPGTTRKSLPGKRPDSAIVNTDGTLANDRNGEEKSKLQRTNRICEIVTHLVKSSGGVFPTERALHWAVLKVYMAMFPGPDYPTPSGCARGVSLLVREGVLKTATVAVRVHGMWKSLKLVLLADLDPNHPAVSNFKEKAKEVEVPEMFIPSPFDLTDDEKSRFLELEKHTEERVRGSGRRDEKAAGKNISRLTAPYYAKTGMAGVRPRYRMRRGAESSGEDDGRPTKRRKADNANGDIIRRRKRKGEEDTESPPVRKKRGRKSAADDYSIFISEPHKLSMDGSHGVNPGISSLPASFFVTTAASNPAGYSAPTKIKFMVPNSHSEYDQDQDSDAEPDAEPEPESMIEQEPEIDPIDPALASIGVQDQPDPEPSVTPGTHTDTTELQAYEGSKGVWPSFPVDWWEKNGGSFAMRGWLPGNSEQLMENIPKTMEQMAFKNKSRCKTNQWADPNYGDFCTSVDGCRTYELSEVGMRALSGTVGTNYLWMNFTASPAVSNMAPIYSQWFDQNEWTLETIPYEMLESDDDEDLERKLAKFYGTRRPTQRRQPRVQKRKPRTKDQPRPPPPPSTQLTRRYGRKQDRDPNLRELKLQRELTAYPREPNEYFRTKGQELLGVDWKAEDTRIAAYVAVSTLMGGINKAMDWGLLMRLFPESKLSNLRKFWSMIRKERDGFILTLTSKFQEDFLVAYEKGELPPFDYEKPLDYDWPLLVKWTLALVVREGIELPPNRMLFDEGIELVHVDKNDFDWRETYHHWQRSVFNKFQDSTSEPAATVVDLKQPREENDIVIARSWVRALCCTEADQYTPYKIRDKFLELTREGQRSEKEVSDLLQATIFDLEHRRIAIKQKSSALATNRPYKLNEHFSRTLDRYSNEDKFTVAAEFKHKMDVAFRKGQVVEIPWRTEDGMVLAAFNLQAAGRVHVEPMPSSRLNIPFGFKPGFYESRKFPKSYYRFDLQIRPTAAYLYNEQIELLHRATAADNIPAATEDGKLPMWCDFFGRPDRHRWFKMLGGVLFVLSTRGAMTDEFTTQALKPCFEQFEVEAVRKWGLREGLLREVTVAGGAVTVTEWWWLILGAAMLDASGGGAAKVSEEAGVGNGRRTRDQYAEWASGRSRRRGKYRTIH